MGDKQIIPPEGTVAVQTFSLGSSTVGVYRNGIGGYAVVSRVDGELKGMVCVSEKQASDIYAQCIEKIQSSQVKN
jgi:hypothetical protein